MPARAPLGRRQRGTVLLIALVFLVVLTLLAISGVGTGVVSLRLAHNAQLVLESQSSAQQQIEGVLNSSANFYPTVIAAAPSIDVDVNGDGVNDVKVNRARPRCLSIRPAPGYSYAFAASAPKDTVWDVVAVATDAVFGTSVTVRQGVKIRLPVDASCVNP